MRPVALPLLCLALAASAGAGELQPRWQIRWKPKFKPDAAEARIIDGGQDRIIFLDDAGAAIFDCAPGRGGARPDPWGRLLRTRELGGKRGEQRGAVIGGFYVMARDQPVDGPDPQPAPQIIEYWDLRVGERRNVTPVKLAAWMALGTRVAWATDEHIRHLELMEPAGKNLRFSEIEQRPLPLDQDGQVHRLAELALSSAHIFALGQRQEPLLTFWRIGLTAEVGTLEGALKRPFAGPLRWRPVDEDVVAIHNLGLADDFQVVAWKLGADELVYHARAAELGLAGWRPLADDIHHAQEPWWRLSKYLILASAASTGGPPTLAILSWHEGRIVHRPRSGAYGAQPLRDGSICWIEPTDDGRWAIYRLNPAREVVHVRSFPGPPPQLESLRGNGRVFNALRRHEGAWQLLEIDPVQGQLKIRGEMPLTGPTGVPHELKLLGLLADGTAVLRREGRDLGNPEVLGIAP